VKSQRAYAMHVLECIARINADSASGRDAAFGSHTLQDAIIRNLQVLCDRCAGWIRLTRTRTRESTGRRFPVCGMCWFTTISMWILRLSGMSSPVTFRPSNWSFVPLLPEWTLGADLRIRLHALMAGEQMAKRIVIGATIHLSIPDFRSQPYEASLLSGQTFFTSNK